MIIDQHINACQLLKVRSLITGWVKYFQDKINIELKCPLKKGLIIAKNLGFPSKKVLKQMSPAFIPHVNTSQNKTKIFEFTFVVTVTFTTKINKQVFEVVKYYDDGVRMSNYN
jgi:hypothetical protein